MNRHGDSSSGWSWEPEGPGGRVGPSTDPYGSFYLSHSLVTSRWINNVKISAWRQNNQMSTVSGPMDQRGSWSNYKGGIRGWRGRWIQRCPVARPFCQLNPMVFRKRCSCIFYLEREKEEKEKKQWMRIVSRWEKKCRERKFEGDRRKIWASLINAHPELLPIFHIVPIVEKWTTSSWEWTLSTRVQIRALSVRCTFIILCLSLRPIYFSVYNLSFYYN